MQQVKSISRIMVDSNMRGATIITQYEKDDSSVRGEIFIRNDDIDSLINALLIEKARYESLGKVKQ